MSFKPAQLSSYPIHPELIFDETSLADDPESPNTWACKLYLQLNCLMRRISRAPMKEILHFKKMHILLEKKKYIFVPTRIIGRLAPETSRNYLHDKHCFKRRNECVNLRKGRRFI